MSKPKAIDIWMPLFIGDYLADTMHLTTTGHGAYLLILMAYWKNGGPLPDNDVYLAGIAKLSPSDWQATRLMVASFFKVRSGFWIQERADREILQAKVRRERNIAGARTTNAKRWGKVVSHSDSESESHGVSPVVSPNGRSSPSQIIKKKRGKSFVPEKLGTGVAVGGTSADLAARMAGGAQPKFTPPSLEEVRAHCLARKNRIRPEAFIAFYASKGWKVGNQPMKDWQQAIITWEVRDGKSGSSNGYATPMPDGDQLSDFTPFANEPGSPFI